MRTLPLALLLMVPLLSGCLGEGAANPPANALDAGADADWTVAIEGESDVVFVGDAVSLHATPVLENASYQWLVDGVILEGPIMVAILPEGSYLILLKATLGNTTQEANTTIQVVPAPPDSTPDPDDPSNEGGDSSDPGTGGGGSGGGSGSGSGGGSDSGSSDEPCTFPEGSVRFVGKDNEFTISYPWTCQPDSWEWDLGDGTTSRLASVHHVYARDQTYTVTLRIVHDGETLVRTGTLSVTNVPLRIRATLAEDTATFSLTWGRDVESVVWDFGDGTTSTDLAPSHTFESVGPWTVNAQAKASDGTSASTQKEVYLDGFPLVISFDVDKDTTTFDYEWGWLPDSILWTFAHDQSTSVEPKPVVQYTEPGTYEARLEIRGEGRTATTVATVTIEEVPIRIEADQDKNVVTFTPVWYGELTNLYWNFGDGFTSTNEIPTHAFLGYGDFTIQVSATGDGVGQTSKPVTVTITEIPLTISGTLDEDNVWNAFTLWAPATSTTWDFGDGSTGTGEMVAHEYKKKGTYTVQATATDGTHTESATYTLEVPTGIMPDWGDADSAAVRPGTQMQSGDQQCTAAFLLHDAASRFFIATAAHCVGTAGGPGGAPSTDCTENVSEPLGTKATFDDWSTGSSAVEATLAYSSWYTMVDKGITDPDTCALNDFAMFEIKDADLSKVHPAVVYFGGPLDSAAAGTRTADEEVRGYGASSTRNRGAVQENHATNAKGGVYLSYEGGWHHTVRFDNPAIPGDSGGPLLTATGDALGVLSTIQIFPNVGENGYTDLAKALEWMSANTDLQAEVVPWDEWDPTLASTEPNDSCILLFCPSDNDPPLGSGSSTSASAQTSAAQGPLLGPDLLHNPLSFPHPFPRASAAAPSLP